MATDGDLNRRRIVNSLRVENCMLDELKKLELFDQQLLFGTMGINYDPKHLAKRLRGMLISDKRSIVTIKRGFNKGHLIQLFPKNIYQNIDALLNVKDKQNVPHAVKLLQLLLDLEEDQTSMISDVINEIKVFGYIAKLLLSIFADTQINLLDQLTNLSQLSFLLLILYRKHGTSFMMTALYQDIQSTIQDAYVCVAIFKSMAQSTPLLLLLLGTDQLESLFSIVRTVTHSNNCDFLELIDKLKAALQVENVYRKNPQFDRVSRLSVSQTLDHSSINDWNGEHDATKISLQQCWKYGKNKAIDYLTGYGYKELEIIKDLHTVNLVMEPDSKIIVGDLEEDEVLDQEVEATNSKGESIDVEKHLNFQDYLPVDDKFDHYIEYDSSNYHKSNLVNSVLNNKTRISSDRLIRVQMKAAQRENIDETIDDVLKLTDTIITVATNKKTKELGIVFVVIDKIYWKTCFE